MPTLKAIIQERDFASNMTQLLDIMKGIANAAFVEMKKEKASRFETFVNSFSSFFQLADLSKAKHPFIQASAKGLGIILITSDQSFMGGLNSKIVRVALEIAGDQEDVEFMVLGSKGTSRIKSLGKPYKTFATMTEKNMYDLAVEIKNYAVERFKARKIGRLVGIFANPVSFTTQEATPMPLLPAHDLYDPQLNSNVDPEDKIVIESSVDKLMEYLADIWIVHKMYAMFEDNKMSEYAAQSMQLEGSLQNLVDMNKKLKLQFVKSRREVIDSSLREVVASLLVVKK